MNEDDGWNAVENAVGVLSDVVFGAHTLHMAGSRNKVENKAYQPKVDVTT